MDNWKNNCIVNSLIFILVASLSVSGLNAQTFIVKYDRLRNLEKQDSASINEMKNMLGEENYNKIMQFESQAQPYKLTNCNGVSLFENDVNTEISDHLDLESDKGSITFKVDINSETSKWYKNFNTQEYISNQPIMDKYFLIQEPLQPLDWQLEEETKKIGDFLGKKATLIMDDNTYEAYYTEDIPISDGPEDYYGLPGLIVELSTPDYQYYVTSVQIVDSEQSFQAPNEGKKVTKKEFDKIQKEKERTITTFYK